MTDRRNAVQRIDSSDDPRIAVYRNVKDRELARLGDRFLAEGRPLVERLLASDFPVESVLLEDRLVGPLAPLVPPGVAVYAATPQVTSAIIGYPFHQGAIACGRRKPPLGLDHAAARWTGDRPLTVVVLPEVTNAENLGALLRISAGFGVDAVVLGPRCCDPFYRQAVRVSMGAVFRLPLVRSEDLAADLDRLRRQWGVEIAATVLDEDAQPLAGATRGQRLALVFGNEYEGLAADVLALCDRRLTIPMALGTDSLNVAVAAGIFLYHFTSRDPA